MSVTADALDAGLLQFSDGAIIGTGGFVETPNQRLGVQHVLPIVTPEDLAKVVGRRPAPTARRCASPTSPTSMEDHQPLIGDAVINGGPGPHADRREAPVGATRSR